MCFFSWNESVALVYARRDLGIVRLNREGEKTNQKMYFNKSHTIHDDNGHTIRSVHTHHTILCESIDCVCTPTHTLTTLIRLQCNQVTLPVSTASNVTLPLMTVTTFLQY